MGMINKLQFVLYTTTTINYHQNKKLKIRWTRYNQRLNFVLFFAKRSGTLVLTSLTKDYMSCRYVDRMFTDGVRLVYKQKGEIRITDEYTD